MKIKILLFVICIFAISCQHHPSSYQQAQQHENLQSWRDVVNEAGEKRIIMEASRYGVYCFKIDGHEYICNSNGGIIHSESCPCKKQNQNFPN
jgi:hypothetical protein